ncbi:unnamed protein product [Prorocentrum cordatum]|uniref:Uncharacterized protein n=1 Tax=Prorocentrum cordatum TaxID=2364126 RepID=A0ABN9QS11_9DINO|nr:unnamed protein product [Polarella glacialis]
MPAQPPRPPPTEAPRPKARARPSSTPPVEPPLLALEDCQVNEPQGKEGDQGGVLQRRNRWTRRPTPSTAPSAATPSPSSPRPSARQVFLDALEAHKEEAEWEELRQLRKHREIREQRKAEKEARNKEKKAAVAQPAPLKSPTAQEAGMPKLVMMYSLDAQDIEEECLNGVNMWYLDLDDFDTKHEEPAVMDVGAQQLITIDEQESLNTDCLMPGVADAAAEKLDTAGAETIVEIPGSSHNDIYVGTSGLQDQRLNPLGSAAAPDDEKFAVTAEGSKQQDSVNVQMSSNIDMGVSGREDQRPKPLDRSATHDDDTFKAVLQQNAEAFSKTELVWAQRAAAARLKTDTIDKVLHAPGGGGGPGHGLRDPRQRASYLEVAVGTEAYKDIKELEDVKLRLESNGLKLCDESVKALAKYFKDGGCWNTFLEWAAAMREGAG